MTPICWKCKNKKVVKFSTLQVVYCTDCNKFTRWRLKPGQRPLVSSNRGDRKNEPITRLV